MNKGLSHPRFTHFWLPFALAVVCVIIAFWVQDIPLFRRNALLLAFIAGLGFFHPALRYWLLILFCYGFGFYVWTKFSLDIDRWHSMSSWSRLQTLLWLPIGLLCILSAMGMAFEKYKRHAACWLLLALATYFVGYTFEEAMLKNWGQAIAGLGFTFVGFIFAAISWMEREKQRPTQSDKNEP